MINKQLLKNITVFFCLIIASAAFAQNGDLIGKINAYIDQLEAKRVAASAAGDSQRVQMLQNMIDEQKKRLVEDETVKTEEKASGDEQVADLKEDVNKAVAELKGQIDKVKSDNNDAKVGGQVFFRWQKYAQGGTATTPNNFDIDRAYIDVKKKLDWNASARVTLDVARITGAARQNLFDYLKYAYVEAPVDIPGALQLIPWGLTAKVGLQHTMWIDWADKQLGLRFIAKSLLDNESVMSSADFGLGALGNFTLPFMPEIEYHATVLNGTGYATNESNSQKAVAARLNSTVWQSETWGKLLLAVYGNAEGVGSSLDFGNSNNQGGLGVSYQHDAGRVFLEGLTGMKSNSYISGYSLGGVLSVGSLVEFLSGYNLFARVDSYVPNTNASNNERKKSFYGVTYDWGKDVKFSLDMQNAQTGSGAITSILYLHSMITL